MRSQGLDRLSFAGGEGASGVCFCAWTRSGRGGCVLAAFSEVMYDLVLGTYRLLRALLAWLMRLE